MVYYFERPPNLFPTIYNFYATGQLHRAPDCCHQQYLEELQYWNISILLLEKCCRKADSRYGTLYDQETRVKNEEKALLIEANEFKGKYIVCVYGPSKSSLWS